MKKEKLFDLLGEIDDKFYEEAMEDEAQEPSEIIISGEKSKRFFPRALITAAACAAVTAGIGLTAALLYNGANMSLSRDIRYCKDYISDFYSDSAENVNDLSYRVLDLNFDGEDEILLSAEDNYSPVYIFGRQGENPELISIIGQEVHNFFMGTLDGLYPYENGEEKYYYYFFSFDRGADMEARGAAAIRFDGENEKYRQSYLLSYGIISREGSPFADVKFFREGWNIQETEPEMFTDIGEEAFTALWSKYEHLPPISFDDFKNNNTTKTLSEQDLSVCGKYIAENYNNSFTGEVTYKYYFYDLNFDGMEEIVFAPNRNSTPIFIFEKTESEPRFVSCIAEEEIGLDPTDQFVIHCGLYEKFDDLGENIIERYYYFYYDTYASDGAVKAKAAAAIKYDGEKYYTENLLSYGVLNYGDAQSASPSEVCFFRDDLNTDEIRIDGDYSTLEYEEFKKLWDKYPKLPPVDFADISVYCTSYEEICPFVYEDTVYEYNYDYWDCVIKDGIVTSMRGETEWEIYNEITGKRLESAAAMRDYKLLEYLGEWVGEETMWLGDAEMYRYEDKILVLCHPDWENSINWDINAVEADLSEYYRAIILEPCKGHYKYYEPFDLEQVPDIQDSSQSHPFKINGLNFGVNEFANYTAMYRSFSKVKLYTKEVGGYTFDLIGEKVRTDKAANPDMIYCSELYMAVSKDGDFVGSDISARIPVEVSDVHSLPIGGFSDYMPQIYELKDGIVIFTSYQDVSGMGSPFITVKNDKIYPMYGDFTPLIDKDEFYPHSDFYPDIKFTPAFEENILYYGDTAFKFNFDKAGIEGETELFTIIEP